MSNEPAPHLPALPMPVSPDEVLASEARLRELANRLAKWTNLSRQQLEAYGKNPLAFSAIGADVGDAIRLIRRLAILRANPDA